MFMLALAREGDGGDRILASLQFHTLVSNSYYVLSLSVGEGFQEVYYISYMVGGSLKYIRVRWWVRCKTWI